MFTKLLINISLDYGQILCLESEETLCRNFSGILPKGYTYLRSVENWPHKIDFSNARDNSTTAGA